MPYIEGETLRAKLDRETQLGVDEAVRITTEVADATDYAHRRGVIHRDIKPENILLHDGRPMVADFGIALAKALEKLPADRFDGAKAFAAALHDVHFTTTGMAGAARSGTDGTSAGWRGWLRDPRSLAALASVVVLGVTAGVCGRGPTVESSAPVLRLSSNLPDDSTVLGLGDRGGGANDLVLSPDGEQLGFFRDTEVWSIALEDRVATRIGTIPDVGCNILAAVWHPDGRTG